MVQHFDSLSVNTSTPFILSIIEGLSVNTTRSHSAQLKSLVASPSSARLRSLGTLKTVTAEFNSAGCFSGCPSHAFGTLNLVNKKSVAKRLGFFDQIHGCLTGVEPATLAATERCSTIKLQAPYVTKFLIPNY